MTRPPAFISALASILRRLPASPALSHRRGRPLWLVGERSSRRVAPDRAPGARALRHRSTERQPMPSAMLLLGRSRLHSRLRTRRSTLPPTTGGRRCRAATRGTLLGSEALYRLKQLPPRALLRRRDRQGRGLAARVRGLDACPVRPRAAAVEPAVKLRGLLAAWPSTRSAVRHLLLAQTPVDLALPPRPCRSSRRPDEVPKHKLLPDAQYLLGSTRLARRAGRGPGRFAGVRSRRIRRTRWRRPHGERSPGTVAKSGSPASRRAPTRNDAQPSATPGRLLRRRSARRQAGNVKDRRRRGTTPQGVPSHPLASQAALTWPRRPSSEGLEGGRRAGQGGRRHQREVSGPGRCCLRASRRLKAQPLRDAAKSFEPSRHEKSRGALTVSRARRPRPRARAARRGARRPRAYDAVAARARTRRCATGRAAAPAIRGARTPATRGHPRFTPWPACALGSRCAPRAQSRSGRVRALCWQRHRRRRGRRALSELLAREAERRARDLVRRLEIFHAADGPRTTSPRPGAAELQLRLALEQQRRRGTFLAGGGGRLGRAAASFRPSA